MMVSVDVSCATWSHSDGRDDVNVQQQQQQQLC